MRAVMIIRLLLRSELRQEITMTKIRNKKVLLGEHKRHTTGTAHPSSSCAMGGGGGGEGTSILFGGSPILDKEGVTFQALPMSTTPPAMEKDLRPEAGVPSQERTLDQRLKCPFPRKDLGPEAAVTFPP